MYVKVYVCWIGCTYEYYNFSFQIIAVIALFLFFAEKSMIILSVYITEYLRLPYMSLGDIPKR